jgi:tRNA A-37 threonylcarbamoyl transferase component Bud32
MYGYLKGIMHGDLYAHNILCSADGTPLLTDFGAASFVKGRVGAGLHSSVRADLLEKLEVSAFGCLVDDMLGCMYEEEEKNAHVEVTVRSEVRLRELQNSLTWKPGQIARQSSKNWKKLVQFGQTS